MISNTRGWARGFPQTNRVGRSNRRHGYSLVHVIMMLMILGLLMSLTATVLHRAFVTHRSTVEHLNHVTQLRRFERQLTADVHRCTKIEHDEELRLYYGSLQYWSYTTQDGSLIRRMYEAGDLHSEEQWRLPTGISTSFRVDEEQAPRLLQVSLAIPGRSMGGLSSAPLKWFIRIGAGPDASDTADRSSDERGGYE